MQSDLDNELRELFDANAARELPGEPFLSKTRQRVAAIRPARRMTRTFVQVLAIALIAFASPWLIEGSALLSYSLEVLFAQLADFLRTPAGIGLAALGLAIALAGSRRSDPRF